MKQRRSREKFFLSWAESIAEAAKTGGTDQDVLDWNSYDVIKQDLIKQQLQLATEEAKVKEMAKITRAEKKAQARPEKPEKLAHKGEKDEVKARERKEKAKSNSKSTGKKEELKLMPRLTKVIADRVSYRLQNLCSSLF